MKQRGEWFWWGKFGVGVAKQLYRMMYDRYTNYHHLDNLIWVWNSPRIDGYVDDDVCDVISRDMYPPAHQHTDQKTAYEDLCHITSIIPCVSQLSNSKVPWVWYMTWCGEHVTSEKYTDKAELNRSYHDAYAITLDKLPKLY